MAKQSDSSKRSSKSGSSQAGFYKILGLVGAVAAILLVYQLTKPKTDGAMKLDPNTPLPEATGYTIGRPDAPVRVIEFADFECPACANFAAITEPEVRSRLVDSGLVRYTFMDFPLAMHKNTWTASNAAACANEQGKFWEMHDLLFQFQDKWAGVVTTRPKGPIKDLAGQVAGLNMQQWEECLDGQKYVANIRAHEQEAVRSGAGSTPTFIIGTRLVPGSIGMDKFRAYVDTALAESRAQAPDTAAKK